MSAFYWVSTMWILLRRTRRRACCQSSNRWACPAIAAGCTMVNSKGPIPGHKHRTSELLVKAIDTHSVTVAELFGTRMQTNSSFCSLSRSQERLKKFNKTFLLPFSILLVFGRFPWGMRFSTPDAQLTPCWRVQYTCHLKSWLTGTYKAYRAWSLMQIHRIHRAGEYRAVRRTGKGGLQVHK